MVKIGILEDDSLMRLALSEALKAMNYEVVFTSGNPADFIDFCRQRHVEVVILDVHLGGGITGIDVGHNLRSIYPKIGIVLLTSFVDPRLASSSKFELPAGSIYVEKSKIDSIETIGRAITAAISGASKDSYGSSPELGLMTNTQIEVLKLVADGLSNQQIAERQGTSVKNVEGLISRIIRGLNLKDIETQNQRVHMARAYFRYRGVRLDD